MGKTIEKTMLRVLRACMFSHSLDPKLPLSYEGRAALITAETSRDRVQMKRLCDRRGLDSRGAE